MSQLHNLGDLLDRERDPDRIAVIDTVHADEHRRFTHRDIDREAMAVARGLVARGYRRGDRIAIIAANRAEYLASYFGIMRAGMVAVPVNWKLPRETIHYVLEDAGVRFAFADPERRAELPPGLPAKVFDEDYADFLDPGPFESVRPGDGEVAMFLYTSGSTGRPKGVPLTHAGHLWVIRRRLELQAGPIDHHRLLVAAPLYHMNALAISKLAMAGHASIVLLPVFRARAYVEAIDRHRVTWLTSVPTMLALVVQETEALAGADLSSVRIAAMGSAPVTPALLAKVRAAFPGAAVVHGYGTTEAGPVAFGAHPAGLPRPEMSLGHPLPDIGFRLVGPDGRAADEGVLETRTPALMPGYHNLPEKTAEVMTPDGWYHTKDVMRRDADGFVYFVGRSDDMFVCGGENIYPGEVEQMLERHPAIRQAAVIPVPDEVRGQKPVAFVVPEPGAVLSEQDVKDWSLANAPAYQHPRRVAFVEDLPLASTNKIDRKALIERATALFA